MSYLLVIIYTMEEEKVPTVDNNFVHSSQEDLPTHEQSSCTNLELSKVETEKTGTSPTALPVSENYLDRFQKITFEWPMEDGSYKMTTILKDELVEYYNHNQSA